MIRARRAATAAVILVLSVAAMALAAAPPPVVPGLMGKVVPSVAWPPSGGLLISEVVTGGASASDEFIELTNAGSSTLDLSGFEVAYASSAGASATRRAGWSVPTPLGPGRHVLVANSAGIYAPGADATYTAGISATGGAVVVRPAGGDPIDAVGWGDATNSFVEGAAVDAPPAGSSIERRPGGSAGNVTDTNNNAADWLVNPSPNPENLGAPPRPVPGSSPTPSPKPSLTPSPTPKPTPSPTPTPRPTPSPTPTPVSTPSPTATPTPTPVSTPSPTATPTPTPVPTPSPTPSASPTVAPTPSPTPIPSPTPTPVPTATPTPTPVPTATPTPTPVRTPVPTPVPTPGPSATPIPTPTPTQVPTPTPAPSSGPTVVTIAQALAQGGKVTVEGVATTTTRFFDASGRLLVIQDATAAIQVRLPVAGTAAAAGLAGHAPGVGSALRISGTLGRTYGAPRLTAASVTWLGSVTPPMPLRITTAPGARLEWRLVQVNGRLDTVHKLGDRWRAEIVVGAVRIPIGGLSGAAIAVGRLFTGRQVAIVGIVHRAYPTAVDQRFAIDPRSISDLAFEQAGPARPAPTHSASGGDSGVAETGYGPGVGASPETASTGSPATALPLVDLRNLASYRGRQVKVGGLVSQVIGSVVSLDDGTASGRLIIQGEAAPYLDLIEVGDPIEVDGLVEADASGPYLLVTDPEGVIQTGDPAAVEPASPDPGGLAASPGAVAGIAGSGTAGDVSGSPAPGSGPSGRSIRTAGSFDPLGVLAAGLLGAVLAMAGTAAALRGRSRSPRPGPDPAITSVEAGPEAS